MLDFLQRTLDGLLEAGPYAVIGLGLTLSYAVLRRLNLAYGAGALLAAYIGSWLHTRLGVPVLGVWVGVIVSTVIIGMYVEFVCFSNTNNAFQSMQRSRTVITGVDEREVTALAASFALWMQLEQLAVNFQPNHLHPFPDLASTGLWAIGSLTLRPDRVTVFILTAVMVMLLALWLERSAIGLGLRAVADEPAAAHLCGMKVSNLHRIGFALSCAICGVASCAVLSIDGQVTPMFGMWVLLKGLTAALLGGLGSIRGVLWGAAALGIAESHAQAAWGAIGRDAATWSLLLLALLLQARKSKTLTLGMSHE